METLHSHLRSLAPALRSLTGEEAVEGLLRFDDRLLQPIVTGLEWHLGQARGRTDLSLFVTPDDPLCRQLAGQPGGSGPVWAWITQLCANWPRFLKSMFLEFDEPDGTKKTPSVLLYVQRSESTSSSLDIFEKLWSLVPPELAPLDQLPAARTVFTNGLRDEPLTCLGIWTGRTTPTVRLTFGALSAQKLREILGREHGQLLDVAEKVGEGHLLAPTLDVGATSRLGFSMTDPHQMFLPATQWFVPLLDRLVGHGLCTTVQREELLRWPGRVGDSLKRLAYFKVTSGANGEILAKVYYGTAQIVPSLMQKLFF